MRAVRGASSTGNNGSYSAQQGEHLRRALSRLLSSRSCKCGAACKASGKEHCMRCLAFGG